MGKIRESTKVAGAAGAQGVVFGIVMGVFRYAATGRAGASAAAGVTSGLLFGGLMGVWTVRERRRAVSELDGLFQRRSRTEIRQGLKRPEGADPGLRADLRRLVDYRLAQFDRQSGSSLIVLGLLSLLTVVEALISSAWWWLAVPFQSLVLVLNLHHGRRLRRQSAQLAALPTSSRPDCTDVKSE